MLVGLGKWGHGLYPGLNTDSPHRLLCGLVLTLQQYSGVLYRIGKDRHLPRPF